MLAGRWSRRRADGDAPARVPAGLRHFMLFHQDSRSLRFLVLHLLRKIENKKEDKSMRKKWTRWLTLGLWLIGLAWPALADIPAGERAALMQVYNDLDGPNWIANTGWGSVAGTECSWFGVDCDNNGAHVIGLMLASNQLSGAFPDLSGLPQLKTLWLHDNALSGSLPASLSSLPIVQLRLSNNQLTGQLPDFAAWPNLVDFVVDHNGFTGPVPASLSDLNHLAWLDISHNQLSGSLPEFPDPEPVEGAICPNYLQGPSPSDNAWNAFVQQDPWWEDCEAPPVQAAIAPVPTLAQWVLLVLAGLLAGLGMTRLKVWHLHRRS